MHPEARLSKEVAKILRNTKSTEVVGRRIESSHTAPGFPDWILFTFGKVKTLELKVHPNTLDISQRAVHNLLGRLEHYPYVLTKYPNSVIVVVGGEEHQFSTLEQAIKFIIGDQ